MLVWPVVEHNLEEVDICGRCVGRLGFEEAVGLEANAGTKLLRCFDLEGFLDSGTVLDYEIEVREEFGESNAVVTGRAANLDEGKVST